MTAAAGSRQRLECGRLAASLTRPLTGDYDALFHALSSSLNRSTGKPMTLL